MVRSQAQLLDLHHNDIGWVRGRDNKDAKGIYKDVVAKMSCLQTGGDFEDWHGSLRRP